MSCVSSEIYDSPNLKRSVKLELALTQAGVANQLFSETQGVVRLPVKLGGRNFQKTFMFWLIRKATA